MHEWKYNIFLDSDYVKNNVSSYASINTLLQLEKCMM